MAAGIERDVALGTAKTARGRDVQASALGSTGTDSPGESGVSDGGNSLAMQTLGAVRKTRQYAVEVRKRI